MRGITKNKFSFSEDDLFSLDERIAQTTQPTQKASGVRLLQRPEEDPIFTKSDYDPTAAEVRVSMDAEGRVTAILDEGTIDANVLQREQALVELIIKASQNIVPSFYEGGEVYIADKGKDDVTDTEGNRRAIHTISNYYNTLGIFRDDFDKSLNDKMARNAYYAIGEKAIMDYFGTLEWTIKDTKDGSKVEKAIDFMRNPNPQDSFDDIKKMVVRDLIRYDAGCIVKTFNKGGYLNEIKAYMGTEFWREQDRVPLIINVPVQTAVNLTSSKKGAYFDSSYPTYQGWWSHGYTERFWQRSRTGVYIPFQPEEISYFMMYPRTDGIYGTDFIKFLKYQMQYLIDSTKAAGKTFENGIVPSIVWEHPDMRSLPQLKARIKEAQFNNQGANKFGSVLHAVNGEKISSLAQSLHDMQWLEGQKFVAQLIWAMWGFSQDEFLGGGANRATAYVKRNITKSRMLYPLMDYFEQKINREILPYIKGYRKSWRFEFLKDVDLDDRQKIAQIKAVNITSLNSLINMNFPVDISLKLADIGDDLTTDEIENLTDHLSKMQLQQMQMAVAGTAGTDVMQNNEGQGGQAQGQDPNGEQGRYNQEGAGTPGYQPVNFSDYGLGGAGTETRTGEHDDQIAAKAEIEFMEVKGSDDVIRKCPFIRFGKDLKKAKVYITHPSEAPGGRSVKRGNRGGYYYITANAPTHTPGQQGAAGKTHHAHPGWGRSPAGGEQDGGAGGGGGAVVPPSENMGQAPKVHIEGENVGVTISVQEGQLIGEINGTEETNQFLKYVAKQTEGMPPEQVIEEMVKIAQENGLEVT
jgi:hypothetical protein